MSSTNNLSLAAKIFGIVALLSGASIVIGVMAPDAKNWWRNFLGDGAPITLLDFDGRDRSGHAKAERDERGRVSVTVKLDD